ncbi:MAG TPA: EpsI family protein [Terriglobales bacterium]|nr:EpsI family protein [Terriglobales bacterium]
MKWQSNARFVCAVIILLCATLLLGARSKTELIAPHRPLAQFPRQLGNWLGNDVSMDKETLDVLGPGDFLLRVYDDEKNVLPPVDLFVAYFPSQRAGDTIHSPKHCLPGAGWHPVESGRVVLSFPGRRPFMANRYVIARGEDRDLVLYWYQAHDRAIASEYWAKFYLIADAIRMNRSDGSLVRLTTPIIRHERADDAQARIGSVAAQVVPLLDQYVPR